MQTLSSFARLVEMPENRSALAAIRDMLHALRSPETATTTELVFLHGPAGSGKTALVNALVELAQEADLTASVVSANDFPLPPVGADTEARPAGRKGKVEEPDEDETRQRLKDARQCSLLVVEDLQHLPLRAAEALVQLIDRRLRRQAPVLITATNGPRHVTHRGHPLPTRLTNRLAGGLVIAVEPWSAESRRLFLQEQAIRRGLDLPAEALTWLADNLTAGGRQLDAALRQIETLLRLQKQQPALERLREHFRDEVEAQRPTVERIVDHVGGYYRVEPRHLKSSGRSRHLLLPRQVSMYLARRLTPLSLQRIGAFFGGRDHTTVLHACKKIEESMKTDADLSGAVRRMHAELT